MGTEVNFLKGRGSCAFREDMHKCKHLIMGVCDIVWSGDYIDRNPGQGRIAHMLEIVASSLETIKENFEAGNYDEPIKEKEAKEEQR